jgi:hypothetical protein
MDHCKSSILIGNLTMDHYVSLLYKGFEGILSKIVSPKKKKDGATKKEQI